MERNDNPANVSNAAGKRLFLSYITDPPNPTPRFHAEKW